MTLGIDVLMLAASAGQKIEWVRALCEVITSDGEDDTSAAVEVAVPSSPSKSSVVEPLWREFDQYTMQVCSASLGCTALVKQSTPGH